MKLIRKSAFIFAIVISMIFGNAKSKTKKTLNLGQEAIDSELIFLEKLYTLDTSIKNESLKKQNKEKSGFEEFDKPITKISQKEDSISSDNHDEDTLKDSHEDKFAVENNSQDDNFDAEKDNFKDQKKNEKNIQKENTNFLELGSETTVNTNSNDFFRNKLDEINKFEIFLLDQEKQLEQKSRELLEKTKSFLK